MPLVVLPEALTGVAAPIVVLSGRRFPTARTRSGPAYSILMEKQVDGRVRAGRAHAGLPVDRQLRHRRRLGGPAHGLPVAGRAARGDERRALREDPRVRRRGRRDARIGVERQGDLRPGAASCAASRRTASSTSSRSSGTTASTTTARPPPRSRSSTGSGCEVGAFVSAMGSAGTIAAGEAHQGSHPGVAIVAVEPVQCPTLYDVGFGAHRIEGIGDKHVTWIHNVLATDLLVCIDDLDCLRGPAAAAGGNGHAGGGGRAAEAAAVLGRRVRRQRRLQRAGGDQGRAALRPRREGRGGHGRHGRLRPLSVGAAQARRRARADGRRRGAPPAGRSSAARRRTGCSRARPPCAGAGTTRSTSPGSSSRARRWRSCARRRIPRSGPRPGAAAGDRPRDPRAAVMGAPPFVDQPRLRPLRPRFRRGLDGPCPRCGPEGVLDVMFDLRAARPYADTGGLASRPRDMWRYRELLPVPRARAHARRSPSAGRRSSPAPRLAAWAGVRTLRAEGRGPQPDRVVQGPRERRRRHARAGGPARGSSPARPRATRRRRSRARRPASASRP